MPTTIPLTPTDRGFLRGEFTDVGGSACSIQESSRPEDWFLFLGREDGRMHLDQDTVRALLPLLVRFVERGHLSPRGEGSQPMTCPECKADGMTSRVYPSSSMTTDMYFAPFYDEAGARHHHDENTVTTAYECSNGHLWQESGISPCPCGWPKSGPYAERDTRGADNAMTEPISSTPAETQEQRATADIVAFCREHYITGDSCYLADELRNRGYIDTQIIAILRLARECCQHCGCDSGLGCHCTNDE